MHCKFYPIDSASEALVDVVQKTELHNLNSAACIPPCSPCEAAVVVQTGLCNSKHSVLDTPIDFACAHAVI